MRRLTSYLVGLFAKDAAALFAVALVMVFLVQWLRIGDVAAVRGQGLGGLFWQALLALPPLANAFLNICIAIGMARALRTLEANRELHIIHVGRRVPALLAAVTAYATAGMLLVLAVAHLVEPYTTQEVGRIRAQAAADLVGRSLAPNRFARLSSGVTISVGGRAADGEITSFFADDQRSAEMRRTYIADTALITMDDEGYVLQLNDGTIQYRGLDSQFSEISFARYDIALERLTGDVDAGEESSGNGSIEIVAAGLASGHWEPEGLERLAVRSAEGLRVVALCLFVSAVALFPSGRRRPGFPPVEIAVLAAAFFERGVSSYAPVAGWLAPISGSVTLGALALVVLVWRLRVFVPLPRREAAP